MNARLKKFLTGILAAASVFAVASCGGEDNGGSVTIKPVTFFGGTPEGEEPDVYAIAQNDFVSLSSESEDAIIGYSFTEFTADNWTEVTLVEKTRVQISEDCTIYAIAYDENGNHSEVTKASYIVKPVPLAPEFASSSEPDDKGLYARNTQVTISSSSSVENDEIVIYYSTEKELTAATAESAGNVYTAGETVITINGKVVLSAVAKGKNGWSTVTTKTFDVPLAYEEGEYDFDGNIQAVIDGINGSTESVTFGAVTVSGVVTDVRNSTNSGKPYIYIQDKNAGVQIYGTKTGDAAPTYAVGDFVTVEGCTAGQVYATSGVAEVTNFGTITVDSSKTTRTIYFAKIPSFMCDFTEYVNKGSSKLYAFRGTTGEHTMAPDYVFNSITGAVSNAEKINLGIAVEAASGIQFTVWKQLNADDSILPRDNPLVETVTFTTSSEAVNGYYTAGTVVTLSCATDGAAVYYSTVPFTYSEFDASNSEKYTEATEVTVNEDTTIYAIAVKDGEKSQVKFAEFFTPFETTRAELKDDANYTHDGNLAALAESTPSKADGVEYSGYIVAFEGTSRKNFLVQDKNAGVYFYGVTLPTNARVGSKIKFTLNKGAIYNGLYEVTGADVEVVEPKAQSVIYYINLTGKEDFTSYMTGQLCAVRGKASEYNTAKATVFNKGDNGSEKSFFGNVYVRNENVQLATLFTDAVDAVNLPADYIAAPEFSESGAVLAGTTVEITCPYPTDATVYWQFIETGSTETVLPRTEYEGPVAISKAGTLYAVAVIGQRQSRIASAEYTIKADNEEVIDFSGKSNGTEIGSITSTNVTLTFGKGSNQNPAKYYNNSARCYASNTVTFTPAENKIIEKIVITGKTNKNLKPSDILIGENPVDSTATASPATVTWTGTATANSPVSFTVGTGTSGSLDLTDITITYAE